MSKPEKPRGKSPKHTQTKQEIWTHLKENLEFLRVSAKSFDDGNFSEAKRLANTVRLLLRQTGKSKALLVQAGLMPGMGFIDSAAPRVEGSISLSPSRLVFSSFYGSQARYQARMDGTPFSNTRNKIVLFEAWWNDPVITTDTSHFSRRDIVGTLADQLGGSHVDPEVDAHFADLVRGDSGAATASFNDEPAYRVLEVELHSMRQISYEVIKSIERKLQIG